MTATLPPIIVPNEIDPFIIASVHTAGWCVVTDYIPAFVISTLREELLEQWHQGDFKAAGIGRGSGQVVEASIRSDQLKWLSSEDLTPAQSYYWQAMNGLRQQLNQQLYLGLVEFEAHLSVYASGSFYQRHCDQFRGVGLREVTVILYLNDAWQEEDGGQLLLYKDMDTPQILDRISPCAGQLVVFLSAEFPHEVLPARRQRLSLTGWFKKRAID